MLSFAAGTGLAGVRPGAVTSSIGALSDLETRVSRGAIRLDGLDLSPIERAALYTLLKRRPVFKWEREALTDGTRRSLEEKGLIARDGEHWQVTEKVLASPRAGEGVLPRLRVEQPVTATGAVPPAPAASSSPRRIATDRRNPCCIEDSSLGCTSLDVGMVELGATGLCAASSYLRGFCVIAE